MRDVVLEFANPNRCVIQERPASFSELLDRLTAIGFEYGALHGMPFAVDIVRLDLGRLCVGVGNGQWMLMFHPADEDNEPTLYSLGDVTEAGMVPFYFGDVSLMSRKYLVAKSDALRVLQGWFEDGELTDAIKWTNKIY